MASLYACIMAGGKGERFWPLSRSSRPKQLLAIAGPQPMIAGVAELNAQLVPPGRLFVVTTQEQAAAIRAALPAVPADNVIAEPCGRNTAPCIGLAAALVSARDPGAVLAVVPADHCIPDRDVYARTMRDAAAVAEREHALLTIGIEPRYAETGYGYIAAGERVAFPGATVFSRVKQFIEKPSRDKAEALIAGGGVFWNAGMFVFRAEDMLAAFRRFLPEFAPALDAIRASAGGEGRDAAIRAAYDAAPAISIDYAVMEKADNAIVAHGAFAWDDVGSWTSVGAYWQQHPGGNAVKGNAALIDAENCIIGNEAAGVIGVLGVKDLIIVRTGDAVLVCHRDRAQDVKKIVQKLREQPRGASLVD